MNYRREFDIAWQGLKMGHHTYEYVIDDNILSRLGYARQEDFKNLKAKVSLDFEKENGFFLLHFGVDGTADVVCDRCGDHFNLQLWDEFDLVLKLADEEQVETLNKEDESGEIVFIPRSETVINVFEWLYEFIILSFPIQKIHPDLENGLPGCNAEVLALLDKMRQEEEAKAKTIWKDLDQFKDKIKNN